MVILGDHATTDRIPHTNEQAEEEAEQGMNSRSIKGCIATVGAIFLLPIALDSCKNTQSLTDIVHAEARSTDEASAEKPTQQQYVLYQHQSYARK